RASLSRFNGRARADAVPGTRRRMGRRRLGDLDAGRPGRARSAPPAQSSPRVRRTEGEDLPRAVGEAVRLYRSGLARSRRRLRRRRFVPQRGRHRLAGVADEGARAQEADEGCGQGHQMKPTGGSVAAFIADVTPPARQRDAASLTALLQQVSGREPQLWGTIVGIGSCHYRYPTGNEGDMPVLAFAPRKAASTIYLDST